MNIYQNHSTNKENDCDNHSISPESIIESNEENTQFSGDKDDSRLLLDDPSAAGVSSGILNQGHQIEAQTAKSHLNINSVRSEDLSHDSLALAMGREFFDGKARYVAAQDRWYFWNQTYWKLDDKCLCDTKTREFLRHRAHANELRASKEARSLESVPAKNLRKWAGNQAEKLKSKATINAVSNLAQSNHQSATSIGDFDQDLLLLGTPSGAVDLRTGVLSPPDPKHMITKLTACGPAEPGEEPQRWLKFLVRTFAGDQDMIDFMQRLAGYCLTGLTSEHKMFFFHGGGRNGKSVFINTLAWIMKDYASSIGSDLLMTSGQGRHKSEIARLHGKRFVRASEIQKAATFNESLVKNLASGDTLTANYMHQNPFDFRPQLTLCIAGNDKPRLHDISHAMRSRMILVPFEVQIPENEQNPNLEAELKNEGPEILRWMIEGALKWQSRGLDIPEPIRKASKAYLDDQDVLKCFLDQRTIADPKAHVSTTDLFESYESWCREEGLQSEKRRQFKNELLARGFIETRISSGHVIKGIKLS